MWREKDSNPQPMDYDSTALPLSYPAKNLFQKSMLRWIGFEPMRSFTRRIYSPVQSTAMLSPLQHFFYLILLYPSINYHLHEKNGTWTHISNLDKVVL